MERKASKGQVKDLARNKCQTQTLQIIQPDSVSQEMKRLLPSGYKYSSRIHHKLEKELENVQKQLEIESQPSVSQWSALLCHTHCQNDRKNGWVFTIALTSHSTVGHQTQLTRMQYKDDLSNMNKFDENQLKTWRGQSNTYLQMPQRSYQNS